MAGEPPQVQFDLPRRLVAQDVVEEATPPTFRLIEVTVPVSARVVSGDVQGVQEVIVEIDAGGTGLAVHDFAPQTTLGSELVGEIQVTSTKEKSNSFEASLGGQSPIPVGSVVAQVTPTLSAASKNRSAETETTKRLPPKKPVVVSGTISGGQGAFFHLRPSSQTTLEGQHQLSVIFRVPDDWQASQLEVRCWARGERQFLWFDQPQVWGSLRRSVAIVLPGRQHEPHLVAKPTVTAKQPSKDSGESWVPVAKP